MHSPTPKKSTSPMPEAADVDSPPKRRDMADYYQRKVDGCDRRIKRLENQVREMEIAEQRAKDRAAALAPSPSSPDKRRQSVAGALSPLKEKKIDKEQEDKMIQRLTYIKEKSMDALLPPIDNTRPARQMWEKLRPNREPEEDEDEEFDVEAVVERLGVQDVEMRADNVQSRLDEAEENGVGQMWRESIKQISVARRRHQGEEDVDEEEEDEELYVLSQERMDSLGARLWKDSTEQHKRIMKELDEKYYGADANKSVEIERNRQKRLRKGDKQATVKELAARLHDDCMSKKKASMEALEAKYMQPVPAINFRTGEPKPATKLTKERMQEMANRLCTIKQ